MIDDFKRPVPKRDTQPVRLDTLQQQRQTYAPTDTVAGVRPVPQPADSSGQIAANQYNAGQVASEPVQPVQPSPETSSVLGRQALSAPGGLNHYSSYTPVPAAAAPKHSKAFGELPLIGTLLKKLQGLKRWQQVTLGAAAVLMLAGGGAALALNKPQPQQAAKPAVRQVVAAPAPKPITSPLTGLVVTSEQQKRPVTAVMIENSTNAQPQSGLKEAGIVFEAIAEYGITRFMALYQETAAANIGPIRSSRPYYLGFAQAFDASYAHVGGSPDALARIKELGVKDMDQFSNSSAYRRISSRFAPHNVYSTGENLYNLGNQKGWTASSFTPLVRASKEVPAKTPAAAKVDIAISSALYNVHYDYDAVSNSYNRTMGGAPHKDAESGSQLAPKSVVVLAMPYSLMADGYHSQYQTTGSGNMLLFQNGTVTQGTWSKNDPKQQFVFKDGAGADMQLNPGQTWISLVGDITKATYAP